MPKKDWRARIRESQLGSFVVLAATAALVIGGIWVVKSQDDPATVTPTSGKTSDVDIDAPLGDAPEIGQEAPGFKALDLDGMPVDLARIDTPVWLVFNATWCSDCRAEIPDIQQIHTDYGEDVRVISVYVNEDADTVSKYAEQLGLNYTQIVDASGGNFGFLPNNGNSSALFY